MQRPQRTPTTTPTGPWAIALLLAAGATLAALPPAHGCSRLVSPEHGVVHPDGSVSFLEWIDDDERPDRYRWTVYGPLGALRSERELAFGIDRFDGSVGPISGNADGGLLLGISCREPADGAACGTVREVLPDGRAGRSAKLPEKAWIRQVEDDRLLFGDVADGSLTLRALDLADGAVRLVRRIELATVGPAWRGTEPRWVLGPDGELVLAATTREEALVARLDENDEVLATARAPAARWDREHEEDGRRRLGPFSRLRIADDGRLLAYQHKFGPDCHTYQPPSIAVFDRQLELVSVIDADRPVRAMRPVDGELVLLLEGALVVRLDDRDETARWQAEVGWQRERAELGSDLNAQAAALERTDPPERWMALFRYVVDEAKQEAILAWLVEEGEAAFTALDDGWLQQLADRMCAAHPEATRREVLRRFDRSGGRRKVGWLDTVVACLDRPVPRVQAFAADLDPGRYRAERLTVFEAWGYPAEAAEALWRDVLGAERPRQSESLVRAFDTHAAEVERLLEQGTAAERARLGTVLLETMLFWNEENAYRLDRRARTARTHLVRAAETWAGSERPDLARLGGLLLLGHGAHPAADLVPELLAAAGSPPAFAWLALALQQAPDAAALPRAVAAEVIGQLIEAPAWPSGLDPERRLGWGDLVDPYPGLLAGFGAEAVTRAAERALAAQAGPTIRRRVVAVLDGRPRLVDPAIMHRLLAAPWIADDAVARSSYGLVADLAWVAADGSGLQRRLTTLAIAMLGRREVNRLPHGAAHDLAGSPLVAAIGQEGVRAVVEQDDGRWGQWLPLIAQVGAWPSIEAELEPMLDFRPALGREAATALAAAGHPRAIAWLADAGPERGRREPAVDLDAWSGPEAVVWLRALEAAFGSSGS